MTKTFKRIYSLLGVLAFLVSFFFGQFGVVAKAETPTIIEYDERSIYDDLADLDLNPDLYVQDVDGSPRAISFMEYCYSNDGWKSQGYYGLYIYVYNPMGKEVKTSGNVANMATVYGEDGKPTDYNNIPLKLLSATKSNLMLKFKVENAYERFYALEKKYAASNAANERRYDIAGVQLSYASKVDTTFATTFYFSGYSAGCGENTASESTLKCRSEGLETIKLEPQHTYYRTNVYDENYECDEIDTVYFGVPKEYFDDEFKLKAIKAQWYEEKTRHIFVTDDADANAALEPYIGKNVGQGNDDVRYRVLFEDTERSVLWDEGSWGAKLELGPEMHFFGITYNGYADGDYRGVSVPLIGGIDGDEACYWKTPYFIDIMRWLIKVDQAESFEDYNVSSNSVINYMKWYTNAFGGEKIEAGQDVYSADLFTGYIDEGRREYLEGWEEGSTTNPTAGWITQEIDAETSRETDLLTAEQSFWDKFFGREPETWRENCKAIEVLDEKSGIRKMTAEDFAKKYFINKTDAQAVYDYCIDELNNERYPVLFRFAQTKYYASAARFDAVSASNFVFDEDGDLYNGCDWVQEQNGFVARETVFLGFDLIHLRFQDENANEKLIPVVANPVDVINGLDAPPALKDNFNDGFDWDTFWKYVIIALIALVVLVPLIILIANLGVGAVVSAIGLFFKWIGIGLLYLFKGLWWLIKWPFIGIKKLFDVIFHREE